MKFLEQDLQRAEKAIETLAEVLDLSEADVVNLLDDGFMMSYRGNEAFNYFIDEMSRTFGL